MFDEAGPISVVRLVLDLPVFLPKLLSLQTRAVNNSQQGRSKPSAAISSISDQSTRVTEERERMRLQKYLAENILIFSLRSLITTLLGESLISSS